MRHCRSRRRARSPWLRASVPRVAMSSRCYVAMTRTIRTTARASGSMRSSAESRLIDGVSANHGLHDLNVFDLVGRNGVWIVREDDEVRELSVADRALDVFLMRRICAVQRIDANRFVDTHSLI